MSRSAPACATRPVWRPDLSAPAAIRSAMRAAGVVAGLAVLAACDRSPEPGRIRGPGGMMQHSSMGAADTVGLRDLAVPAEFQRGADLFRSGCAACHGEAALGTAQGPPLVHRIYEPRHHADISFVLAAERGVRAHHWGFGDMPPRPEVSREEVMEIVDYVRWLQREAGVY